MLAAPNERVNKDGSSVGLYCKVDTRELVLPPAVSNEKYNYIFDAYFDGAFNTLLPLTRKIILTYFSTGHTTSNIDNLTKGIAYHHLKTGLETIWQNTSPHIKDKYSHTLATSLKDKYEQRRGRPISEAVKEVLRSKKKEKMTQETKDKIRALNKANFTPEMRERSIRAALLQGIKNREKLAETNPQKAAELEKKAKRRYLRTLHKGLINLRTNKFPEYKPLVEPTTPKNTKRKESSTKVRKKTKLISKPSAREKPPKKPDLRVEERMEDPFTGAKRNLRFLITELPPEIKERFILKPQLRMEWKTIFSIVNSYPYFRYEKGALFYVIPSTQERDELYEVTPNLLEVLWHGNNSHFHQDRDNIIKFGRISIEDLGNTLKNALNT